jgi:hypothetical protein
MKAFHLYLLIGLMGLTSCQDPIARAEEAIDDLFVSNEAQGVLVADTAGWKDLLRTFEGAAEVAPNDSLWARYTLISGDVQAQVPGGALYAIRTYMSVHDSLQGQWEGALALFAAAQVWEEKLHDRPRAIQTLTMLWDAYPNTSIAQTALAYRDVLTFENDSSLLEKIHQWGNNPPQ